MHELKFEFKISYLQTLNDKIMTTGQLKKMYYHV
jgi:hypothetical protein